MTHPSNINRRNFIRLTGITTTGLILGLSGKANTVNAVENFSNAEETFDFGAYILINKNGEITLFNSKPEIGQGTFQSIPALIAEELEVSLDKVIIQQTGGEKKFGYMQFAGGSMSIRTEYQNLRKVGASAKEMLVRAAANKWNVPMTECIATDASIIHQPSGRKFGYGELAEDAAKLEVPKNPTLKNSKDFKILGKSIARPDIPLKVNGTAQFGIDASVPGMLYASIERCPVYFAKLISFDDSATKKVKGVVAVETCERIHGVYKSTGVAVIAENYWAAVQGRKALKVNWDLQGNEKFNTKDFETSLRNAAKTETGAIEHQQGDFDKAFAEAPIKLEAFYETPVVSHSPIEPMNCLASFTDGNKLEIWTSTQVPSSIVNDFSKEYKIPVENMKVHTLFNGGGFGRRLYPDYVHEAVQLTKKIGKPVKTIWTREDDTQQGPFRPMTFSALKGALSANGKAIAFQHKVIAPTLDMKKDYDKTKSDGTMTEGISEQKYEIEHMKNLYVHHYMPVPLAAWRAVTSTTLAFSHECFIDEMAHVAKKDGMQFRLDMLTKESDTKKILLKLKEVSNWDKPLPAGWGRGVAQYEFFPGQAGYVIEVSKKGLGIKIEKVIAVIDLGAVVNPDTAKAQVEGAAVMALTAAIKNGITYENGKTVQSNYHNNPLVRIHEMPKVEVHIITEEGAKVKGAGEPGLPPFAPALCNAIFAATGKRIRRLPFDINKIV